MKATILLNTTTIGDLAANGDAKSAALIAADPTYVEALAIFGRFPKGDKAPIEPGDRLTVVGTLDFPDAATTADACNAAFEAGNAPYDTANVRLYRSWQVRSLSVGDVVLTEGRAFAVAGCGWQEVALTSYKIT